MNRTIWAWYSANREERGIPRQSGTAAGEPRQRSISAQRAVFRIPQRTVAASSASSSPRKVHRASSQGAHDAGQKEAARAGGSQWPR